MRDYQKEHNWEARVYKRLVYKCNVDLWDRFDEVLKEKNLTYSEWIRNKIHDEILESGRAIIG